MNDITLAKIDTAMGAARQLIKGTTADKLAYLMRHLPQSIVDGQLINYKGESIGATDLEDQVLVKVERLSEAKQITDALMTDIFHPINTRVLVAYAEEGEKELPKLEGDKKGKKKESKSEELADDEIQLIKAIDKGKAKKASKLLKELNKSGTLSEKQWKKYKKQIKGI